MLNETSLTEMMRDGIEGCILEYDSVKDEVAKLFGNYNSLEHQIVTLKSPFHKIYAKTRNKVLGKEPPSINDLLRLQGSIVSRLSSELSNQLNRTESSLESLAEYSDVLDFRICEAVGFRKNGVTDIFKLKEEVLVLQKRLPGLRKDSQDYYDCKRELKGKLRSLDDVSATYVLFNEAIRDNLAISTNVVLREELLRVSARYAKSLVQASGRYSEFLGVIRGVYADFLRQDKLYAALVNTVRQSRDFISALDSIVVNGQVHTARVASGVSDPDYKSNLLLGDSAASLRNVYGERSVDAEVFVENYLGR